MQGGRGGEIPRNGLYEVHRKSYIQQDWSAGSNKSKSESSFLNEHVYPGASLSSLKGAILLYILSPYDSGFSHTTAGLALN